MFYGRTEELDLINQKIKNTKFEFGLLYGRRRVGKTFLLKEILKNNLGIYFVATELSYDYNVNSLGRAVANFFNVNFVFNDLESIFSFIKEKSKISRVLIIIDEFTYLFAENKGLQSLLQKIVDDLKDENIVLIFSGSHISVIEDVITYKKPLYGRTTFKIKLNPFNYLESAQFYLNYNPIDKIRTYAVFGGAPYYLSMLDPLKDLKTNIIELLVKPNGILSNEAEFYLKQELRSTINYNNILYAVCEGATRLNEITTKSQIKQTGTAANYLKTLIDLDIIKKEVPFKEKENSKKTLYRVKNNFFHFYYRFIYKNQNKINILEPNVFYDEVIKKYLDEYVSFIFEDVCQTYLILKNKKGKNLPFYEMGRFFGTSHILKREIEIDILTENKQGVTAYECKWTNDLFRKKEIDNLKEVSSLFKPYRYGGFSKSGFSNEVTKTLDDFYDVNDLFFI